MSVMQATYYPGTNDIIQILHPNSSFEKALPLTFDRLQIDQSIIAFVPVYREAVGLHVRSTDCFQLLPAACSNLKTSSCPETLGPAWHGADDHMQSYWMAYATGC